jgi:ketosteroid isomerase-like protein
MSGPPEPTWAPITLRGVSAALELVKLALRAYGLGDPEITVQLCASLIHWDERASRPDAELVSGQAEVLKAMRSYHGGWERYRFQVEKIAEVGNGRIAGLCRERGLEKDADGGEVDRRYGALWVVEGSKIASWTTYSTPAEAVRAGRGLAPGVSAAEPAGEEESAEAQGSGSPAHETAPLGRPEPEGALRVIEPPAPREDEASFSEEQRAAAKRRAALARTARDGDRRAPAA